MKRFYIYLFVSLMTSCSNKDTAKVNNPTTEQNTSLDSSKAYKALDVSYGNDPKQTFDIYLPANRTKNTSIMMIVHGGGWTSGDKKDMDGIKDLFLKEMPNTAVVNINYRLASKTRKPLPMQTDDISAIINYLTEKQDYYSIGNTFGFTGTSAGAHLALLWSYTKDKNKVVKMVCGIVGPVNFIDPAYIDSEDPVKQQIITVFSEAKDKDYLKSVSPYHQLTESAPPTILFYGGKDPLVPVSQGDDLAEKLKTLNVKHDYTLYPEEGHGWEGLNLFDTSIKLINFTKTHLPEK